MSSTTFGSLEGYTKGGVHVIDDNPKDYAFSNVFDVASRARPYEKVAVAQNLKYVLEAVRAEGRSGWYAASHDEAALIMDGEVDVKSKVGHGTTFYVDLPATPAEIEITPVSDGGDVLEDGGHIADLHRRAALSIPGKMAPRAPTPINR